MRLAYILLFIYTITHLQPIVSFYSYGDLFVNPVPGLPGDFIRGVDLSEVPWILEVGGRFFDTNGVERDVLEILRDSGVNWVRLRVWNNPYDEDGNPLGGGNCDLQRIASFASRAKALGFRLLVNFHYSDWWADPGRQDKPREWAGLTYSELVVAVYEWTLSALQYLSRSGAAPDMVQVGNELDNGFLWPEGRVDNWEQFVTLLKSGVRAVRDFNPDVKVMIHLSGQHEPHHYVSFFNRLLESGVDFDVIGLSFYTYIHGPLEKLGRIVEELTRNFDKTIVVAETAYAWTLVDADGYPNIFGSGEMEIKGGYLASIQGQASLVRDIIETLYKRAGSKAGGVFYWGAGWIPVRGAGWKTGEGNPWENQALFDFNGRALPSIKVFQLIYSGGAVVEPHPLRLYGRGFLSVATRVGMTPELPKVAPVVYSDHSIRIVELDWGVIAPFREAGLYRVTGSIKGTGLAVEALVAVVDAVTLEVPDPEFDDKGPGTYGYPVNPVFKPGVFDITRVTVSVTEEGVIIRVYFRDIGGNPWSAPNGFSLQFIHIYVRTSNPDLTGGVFEAETLGLNIVLHPDYAWQYAILLTPGWGNQPLPTGGLSTILCSSGEAYVEDADFYVSASHAENYVEAEIPHWLIRDWENVYSWRIVVAVTSWDGLSPDKVREFKPGGGEWAIDVTAGANGGLTKTLLEAYEAGVLPKVIDLAVYSETRPAGIGVDEQYGWLMGFNVVERRSAVVPPMSGVGAVGATGETGGFPLCVRCVGNAGEAQWLVVALSAAFAATVLLIFVAKRRRRKH